MSCPNLKNQWVQKLLSLKSLLLLPHFLRPTLEHPKWCSGLRTGLWIWSLMVRLQGDRFFFTHSKENKTFLTSIYALKVCTIKISSIDFSEIRYLWELKSQMNSFAKFIFFGSLLSLFLPATYYILCWRLCNMWNVGKYYLIFLHEFDLIRVYLTCTKSCWQFYILQNCKPGICILT